MMNILNRARKNIVLKFIAEGLIRSLAFLFVVAAARFLGDRDYGHYSLAYFLAGFLTIFSDWGLNLVLIRDVSRDHRLLGRYAGNILSLKILFSLLSLLIGPLILFLLGYSGPVVLMVFLSMIYMQGNHLLDFFVALTNGVEKMEYELLIKGVYKTLVVVLPIAFLWLGRGLWGLLAGLILGYALSCFFSAWVIRTRISVLYFLRDFDLWKYLLRSAWPIGLSALFMTVYARIDMVMLSLFNIQAAEIGWYAIPVKIMEMFSLFPLLVMAGLFPIFSVLTSEDRESLQRTCQKALTLLAALSLPLSLSIFYLSDPWLVVFFGPAFRPSIPSLKILILALPGIFLNYVLFNTLIALNKEKIIAGVCGLAVIFNIGLNLFLLPRYGYLGASWTTVATEIFLLVWLVIYLQRSFFRFSLLSTGLKLVFCGLWMGFIFWGLKEAPVWLTWISALAGYGIALVVLRLITREDWILIKRLISFEPTLSRG
jgi:O-antigen/teichoic acid export membrane protein